MFNNKIIWISGGSTGIGKATALEFIKKGWIVIVTSRNQENLNNLKNNAKIGMESV